MLCLRLGANLCQRTSLSLPAHLSKAASTPLGNCASVPLAFCQQTSLFCQRASLFRANQPLYASFGWISYPYRALRAAHFASQPLYFAIFDIPMRPILFEREVRWQKY
jgi:hypothetical protein